MKMTAIILEDEHIAAKRLKRMLGELANDIDVLESFETIEETASYLISNSQPDILFLDIHVADGNSFELFKIIDVTSKVVFTTAYDQYAIEAFRKNAADYLLKPLKKGQLAEAINRASPINPNISNQFETGYKNRFLIKFGTKLHSVKSTNIAYIYSKNKISYFYTLDGHRYPSDYKLQKLEEMLDPTLFFRANRQFIVHLDSIVTMQRHEAARMKLGLNPPIDEAIVVSTEKTRKFKKWIER